MHVRYEINEAIVSYPDQIGDDVRALAGERARGEVHLANLRRLIEMPAEN